MPARKPKLPSPAQYVGLLNIPEGAVGDYRVAHEIVPDGEAMSDVTRRNEVVGGQRGQTFHYNAPTRWHKLFGPTGVWMTDLPVEQRQMREAAQHLRGCVLVGGLGLGVIAVLLARKPDVHAIYVVEQSREVVALVAEHLIPLAGRRVHIEQVDLFAYLREIGRAERFRRQPLFDTAFFDIWQGDNETTFHETVVPLLRLAYASGRIQSRPLCWNEDVMRGQLHMSLIGRLFAIDQKQSDLASFTAYRQSIWHDWAVPFFQRMQREGWDTPTATQHAERYARAYGDPWAGEWP